jgi:hypothetical protein
MFKFIHHLLNPHCPDCLAERASEKICQSCETLRYEVDRLRADNERLLNRLLEKPESNTERSEAPIPLTVPRSMPWKVRQQMLEAEDRKAAQLRKQAPKPSDDTEELERELGVVEKEREHASAKS